MYGIPNYGLKLGELMFVEIISCDVNVDASIFVSLGGREELLALEREIGAS